MFVSVSIDDSFEYFDHTCRVNDLIGTFEQLVHHRARSSDRLRGRSPTDPGGLGGNPGAPSHPPAISASTASGERLPR
jgi:hypothetical protein